MTIYFAPMEGITDGILRQTHNRIFGGVDVYCLPFHKLTQSMSLLTREERDISPEENEGLKILPQALTKDPDQLSAWLYYVSECGLMRRPEYRVPVSDRDEAGTGQRHAS